MNCKKKYGSKANKKMEHEFKKVSMLNLAWENEKINVNEYGLATKLKDW